MVTLGERADDFLLIKKYSGIQGYQSVESSYLSVKSYLPTLALSRSGSRVQDEYISSQPAQLPAPLSIVYPSLLLVFKNVNLLTIQFLMRSLSS